MNGVSDKPSPSEAESSEATPVTKSVASSSEPAVRTLASANDLKMIEVANLLFDTKNPRHPKTLVGSDEQQVIDWMVENASIIELMNSIGEQGYFPGEPLIVTPAAGQKGKFYVIEGNRRLTALMLLLHPQKASKRKKSVASVADAARHKPTEVPCQVYEKREDVLHFLAFRHVTGIKPWDPLMKARYIRELSGTPGFAVLEIKERNKQLAREIGSTSSYVGRLLTGLAVYEELENRDFFNIASLEAEGDRYSVLMTGVTSYTNIAKYIGLTSTLDVAAANLNADRLRNLARWLFEREPGKKARVPESRALGTLNRVLGNAAALDRFEKGVSLDEADLLTEGPMEVFRASVGEAKSRLAVAIEIVYKATGMTEADISQLHELRTLVAALIGAAKATKDQEE